MGQAWATVDGHCCSTRSRSINPNRQIAHGSPADENDVWFRFNVLVDDFVESSYITQRHISKIDSQQLQIAIG